MSNVTRCGSVTAKANKTDAVFQRFTVQEIDGDIFYFNRSFGDWFSLPAEWLGLIVWD